MIFFLLQIIVAAELVPVRLPTPDNPRPDRRLGYDADVTAAEGLPHGGLPGRLQPVPHDEADVRPQLDGV